MSVIIKNRQIPGGPWADWPPAWVQLPPVEHMLTRDQLIKRVNESLAQHREMHREIEDPASEHHVLAGTLFHTSKDYRKTVTPRTLSAWESRAILPRPFLVTIDGARQVLYLPEVVFAVVDVAENPGYAKNTEWLTTLARGTLLRHQVILELGNSPQYKAFGEATRAFVDYLVTLGSERPRVAQLNLHRRSTSDQPYDYYPVYFPPDTGSTDQ